MVFEKEGIEYETEKPPFYLDMTRREKVVASDGVRRVYRYGNLVAELAEGEDDYRSVNFQLMAGNFNDAEPYEGRTDEEGGNVIVTVN
jgi:hypothetical protein